MYLECCNTNVSDLSPLANLNAETYINLDGNPITDWSPVAHINDVIGRPIPEQPKE